MKEYPNAREHLHQHMDAAARKYADGMIKARIDPSPTLIKALANRTYTEACEDYDEQCAEVLLHNLGEIDRDYRSRARQARRKDAPMLLVMFIAVAIAFSVMTCVSLIHHDMVLTCAYAVSVIVFLLMIVGLSIDLFRKEK